PRPLLSHWWGRSEWKGLGREPEDSGIQESTQLQDKRRTAGLLQPARAEVGYQARKGSGRMGRDFCAGRAKGHRDSLLARPQVARCCREAGLQGDSVEWLLHRLDVDRCPALRSGTV